MTSSKKEWHDPTLVTIQPEVLADAKAHAKFAALYEYLQSADPTVTLTHEFGGVIVWRPETDEEQVEREERDVIGRRRTEKWQADQEAREAGQREQEELVAAGLGVSVEQYRAALSSVEGEVTTTGGSN